MTRTVVVTDGEQRAALAIVRSLGRAGYRCIVGSTTGQSLAGASRYAYRDARLPDAAASPDDYADAVTALVDEEGAALLVPVSEPALLALLPARDRIHAVVPFPDLSVVEAICDKGRVLREAERLGIRVPRQVMLASPADDRSTGLGYPVVLKPGRSVFTAPDGTRGKVGVRWAHSQDELNAALDSYPAAAYPILVQEAVEGPGVGIFVLLHDGEVLARFSHRRLREKPPSGGVSVLRRSEPMDEDLLARSVALLEAFDWSGVAMVEYKRGARTGEAVLMEINGRFWGSLQLAIDAGVDFPGMLADVSFGHSITRVETYRPVTSRWLWGDVDHTLAVWCDERASWGDRFRALAGWARSFGPGHRSDVFRWTDPRPFAHESLRWIQDVTHH